MKGSTQRLSWKHPKALFAYSPTPSVDYLTRQTELLQNPAFAPVVSDLEGNITKVRARYLAQPTKSATLEALLQNEPSEENKTATEGLMWLSRGLDFTHKALHAAQSDPTIELSKAFAKGYDASLKRHHNFLIKGVFSLAMNACPQRTVFYSKLAADPDGGAAAASGSANEVLDKWLGGLDQVGARMQKVYKENKYGEIQIDDENIPL